MSGLYRHTLSFPGRLSGVTSTVRPAQVEEPTPIKPPVVDRPSEKAIAALQASLNAAMIEAKQARLQMSSELAESAVSLAVEIAERLLQNEISLDRQRLDKIVHSCLTQLPASRGLIVRGHADDLDLLQKQLDEHSLIGAGNEDMTLRADPSAVRGVLKLETEDCFLEWNTPHALGELKSRLTEVVQEAE